MKKNTKGVGKVKTCRHVIGNSGRCIYCNSTAPKYDTSKEEPSLRGKKVKVELDGKTYTATID